MKKRLLTLTLMSVLAIGSVVANAAVDAKQNTNTVKTVESGVKQEEKSLFLQYDESKYELIKPQDTEDILLMDKNTDGKGRNVFLGWKYIPNKTLEVAAQEECDKVKGYNVGIIPTIEESDLNVKSTKVIEKYPEDAYPTTVYFIEDNAGGVFRVYANDAVFANASNKEEKENILKSIKIVEKSQNTNLSKVKVQSFLG